MTSIYYIQVEDRNSMDGNSSNTLAGLKNNFAGEKEVLVFSNHATEITEKYAQSGVKTTIYQNDAYTIANFDAVLTKLKQIFRNKTDYLLVFDNDSLGSSLGSRIAALLDITFVADVKKITDTPNLTVTQDIGATSAKRVIPLAKQAVITFSCNGVAANEPAKVDVISWSLNKQTEQQYRQSKSASGDLGFAKVVVAGGKGLGSKEQFKPLTKLAQKLNASVGATKAVTDLGWLSSKRMIGISNLTVTPDVYYAFGISGAVQHTSGMNKSKRIVAVNTDPAAPIFKLANYGIVGDANKVISQLNNLL